MCQNKVISFALNSIIEQTICNNPLVKDHPPAKRLFEIEGYIQLDSVTEETVLFNSKFESGNLR